MDKTDAALADILSKLSNSLGVGVDKIWESSIKQAYINGISEIITLCLTIIVLLCIFYFVYLAFKKNTKLNNFVCSNDLEPAVLFFAAIPSIVFGIILIVSMSYLPMTIASFYNPEYRAFHDITQMIKPSK